MTTKADAPRPRMEGERTLAPSAISFGRHGEDGVAMRFEFPDEEPMILVVHRTGVPMIVESLAGFLPMGAHGRLVIHDDRSLQEIANRRLADATPAPEAR